MKRILSLILVLMMTASIFCVRISAAESNEISKYEQYCYETLIGLDILGDDAEIDQRVTKGEFFDIVAKMLKINDVASDGKLYFRDVSPEHEYYNSISALASMGYLFGDDNQRVYPDEYISRNTAFVIMVRALGYEAIAQRSGGYIAGHINVWSRLELDKGLSDVSDEEFDLGKISILIYNSLLANQPGTEYISDSGIQMEMESGDTLLYSLYGGYEFKGIVNKNKFTSLTSTDRYELEMIRIGDTEMYAENSTIHNYLGYEVRGIMLDVDKDDEDYTLLSFTDYQYNEELTIKSLDIVDVPDTLTVKYDDGSGNKTKTAELTRNVSVIYNYQYLSSYTKNDLDIDSGYLKLVDNDNDGKYDVVFIYEYQTYFVSGVDVYGGYIYDKYGYQMLEVDDEVLITNAYGDKVHISTISQNNVLAVYKPKNTSSDSLTVVEKSLAEPVAGRVDGLYNKNGTYAQINGESYRVSNRYATLSQNNPTSYRKVEVGVTGTFYLDSNNEICAFDDVINDYTYAYLTHIEIDEWKETSKCKVFTQFGQFEELLFHKNLKINGNRVTDVCDLDQTLLFDANTGLAKPQLVKYKTNSEKAIMEIMVSDGTTVLPKDYDSNVVNYNGLVTNGEIRIEAKKYNYQYIYNNDTVIFIIPADINDEKHFYISNKIFREGEKSTMKIYDVDSSYVMTAAVIEGGLMEADKTSDMHLLTITEAGTTGVNEDGEYVDVIRGYYQGAERKFTALQEDDRFDGFKEGDIVHIITDSSTGEIVYTQRMFTFDEATNVPTSDALIYYNEFKKTHPHTSTTPVATIWAGMGLVYGECTAKGDDWITVTLNNGNTGEPFICQKNIFVYVVEKTDRGTIVTPSSIDAVVAATEPTSGNGSKVLLNARNAIVREIYIIK